MSGILGFKSRWFAGRDGGGPGRVCVFEGGWQVWRREPRQWLYATKPSFARLEQPLADALRKADEVRLMVDLGNFTSGEVRFGIEPDGYLIDATCGDMQFVEEIPLPKDVDVSMKEEHFKDGILELVLPRKIRGSGADRRKRAHG